jgi:Ser/Thr protein kinase RdoA (MazF antagonist)
MTSMEQTDFANLTPDRVIDAVESLGYVSDLRVFALNSYENRVYQFGLEEQAPIVVKFYRPERWSDEQILEAACRYRYCCYSALAK